VPFCVPGGPVACRRRRPLEPNATHRVYSYATQHRGAPHAIRRTTHLYYHLMSVLQSLFCTQCLFSIAAMSLYWVSVADPQLPQLQPYLGTDLTAADLLSAYVSSAPVECTTTSLPAALSASSVRRVRALVLLHSFRRPDDARWLRSFDIPGHALFSGNFGPACESPLARRLNHAAPRHHQQAPRMGPRPRHAGNPPEQDVHACLHGTALLR
jgi:hypothetical protein